MHDLDTLRAATRTAADLERRVVELGEVRRDPTHGATYRATLWRGVRAAWRAKVDAARALRAVQGETWALAA